MNTTKEKLFWYKNSLFRPRVTREFNKCLTTPHLSASEIKQINWTKRLNLINFAYNNIEFYNLHFKKAGFHPSMLNSPKAWERIPFLTKEDIKTNFNKLINKKVNNKFLRRSTTGGSTGEPLKVYRDKRFAEEILQWRLLKQWDIPLGSDTILVWRIPHKQNHLFHKIKNYIIWYPTNRIRIDASSLNDNTINKLISKINKLKPAVLYGYTGSLEKIALYVKHNGYYIHKPKLLWSTAAPISSIQWRLFSEIFGDKILDQYACSEIFYIASNCPDNRNLHINYDYRYVDIVDDHFKACPPGEIGQLAITDLENRVFPLIKYLVGDRSKLLVKNCTCGSNMPLMAPVLGRKTDQILLPDGGFLSGEFLTTIFDDYYNQVERFQIYQKYDYSVTILVQPKVKSNNISKILEDVVYHLSLKSGSKLSIRYEIVNSIPDDRGKFRFIISDAL